MQERSDQLPTIRSRAVRLDSFGGPEVLDIREVPAPQAGPGGPCPGHRGRAEPDGLVHDR
jgi:hypothetical protein